MKISIMLALEVSENELTKRLLKRGESSGRSDDQSIEIIRSRIVEYNIKTSILIDYYSKLNKYKSINGMGEVNIITQRVFKSIDSL